MSLKEWPNRRVTKAENFRLTETAVSASPLIALTPAVGWTSQSYFLADQGCQRRPRSKKLQIALQLVSVT